MKSKDLYRWIDHRATMLWVCLKCLPQRLTIVACCVDFSGSMAGALDVGSDDGVEAAVEHVVAREVFVKEFHRRDVALTQRFELLSCWTP